MVFDRKAADVSSAKKIRENKIQKGIALTKNDIEILERGCVTINTLNRIENKQNELKKMFNDMGYFDTPLSNKNWSATQYFTQKDLERICENNAILKKAFFVYISTPKTAMPRYHFGEFNAIERMLSDLEDMVYYVRSQYIECDTVYCGEV